MRNQKFCYLVHVTIGIDKENITLIDMDTAFWVLCFRKQEIYLHYATKRTTPFPFRKLLDKENINDDM